MGQGADQVRRGEPYRLREGESVVISPGAPPAVRRDDLPDNERASGQAIPAGIGMRHGGDADTTSRPADSPEAIEAGIEQTRSELSSTIDAIQQRLNPENLKEEAKDQASELAEHAKQAAREAILEARDAVRDATIGKVENMARRVGNTTEDARYGIVETIKQNPIPAALTGIGLAWLMMNRQSAPQRPQRRSFLDDRDYDQYRDNRYYREGRDRYGYGYEAYSSRPGYDQRPQQSPGLMDRAQGTVSQAADQVGGVASRAADQVSGAASRAADQVGEVASRAGSTISQAAGQAGETASSLVDQAQETAGSLMGQAQQQTRRVEDRVGRAMQETPLAVGAVALAVGAAIGLAVPETTKEQELFGPMRDNLMDQAQGFAQDAMEKVQSIASEAGQTAQREAQAQGLVG